ncbi:MAG: ATP-dependent DNA helicase RecG [Clostridia bacterium]|nr:ATP-dependent DNA helicase RecG [Clostridia bacterium]
MITATTDIQYLKGVGEKRDVILKNKGIDTIGALLRFYPRAYLDWTNITPISECTFYENFCIKARIVTPIETLKKRAGMTIYKFIAEDSSAQMDVTLFNQKFLAEKLRTDREYLFYGKLDGNFYMRQMSSPIIMESGFNGIEPIYPASKTMSSKTIEKLVLNALSAVKLPETLPLEILERNSLCDLNTALQNIHFPKTEELLEKAKKRLVFEELFILQAGLTFLKKRSRGKTGCVIKENCFANFQKLLPFEMTSAQKRVTEECIADMKSGRPMNRLVQGDVGSGKTAVCAALCYVAAKNGFQSALMAPTEILAEQHFKTLTGFAENSGVKCGLLTGSTTKKQKAIIKEALKTGEIDIIVGTHALISDDVEFNNLGLVITDEQHRFGVTQRGKLSSKGENPHTLVMSATPIPRTLGLIIYGDLDISIIDEYPKGRQRIDTYFVDTSYRQRIYKYIKKFLDSGRQGYIVCPLVEENETLDITPAVEYYEALQQNEFRDYRLGLLHGKMSAKDKEKVMRQFSEGEINLLIATTVIEVGIDVPNAVIMVIENAERFGLSQLHQLRGRIGRGEYKSDCILISDSKSGETVKRLNVIKNTSDGFKIADADLELRGPGDFLGSRQHGLPDMKIADLFADRDTLHRAGKEVEWLLKTDPKLMESPNAALREEIKELYRKLNSN